MKGNEHLVQESISKKQLKQLSAWQEKHYEPIIADLTGQSRMHVVLLSTWLAYLPL